MPRANQTAIKKPAQMNILKRPSAQAIRFSALMLVTLWLVSACSGSSDSLSGNSQNPVGSTTSVETGDNAIELTDNAPTVSEADMLGDGASDSAVNENEVGSPVVEDPLIQNSIQVNFDITVPAYQSDELHIELIWGEVNLTAMWVGDELWSASGDFPTRAENPLTITFYDDNGGTELAKYSQEFATGSVATESVQIPAEQFDATQFDSDQDGVSNLAELNAGTDPFLDEDSLLEINEAYGYSYYSRMSVSSDFEARLADERPFFDAFTQNADPDDAPESITSAIDIDANGNGTLSYSYYVGYDSFSLTGTRTHLENAISWEGNRSAYDGDYGHNVNFTNTVSVVDENTRSYVEEILGSNIGTYNYRWEISADLTGQLIDGSSLCEPVAGTASMTYWTNNSGSAVTESTAITVTTVSKELEDPYWRVVSLGDDNETTESFAREFRIGSSGDPDDAYFICDFVDF